ncbi:DUF2142 domain-containing protein [Tepidamorphus sp. 3E244]|uniref:DUF2142 domain-containing protein n=1 Tax=Tepidamorphus sp. 3E244 TaxID=3385498 RepID=UPI0038FBF834
MGSIDPRPGYPIVSRFAAIALFFGTLLVFFVPPIQPPDEDSHFTKTMTLWLGGKTDKTLVPKSLLAWVDSHRYLNGNAMERYSYKVWYEDSHLNRIVTEPRVHHKYSGQNISPLMYAPSLTGVAVGRLLYLGSPLFNYPAALYFGRLGNLLFYVGGVCLVLLLTPAFRVSIAFLALTPVSLHVAAAVHYDALTLVPGLLLLAVFLRRTYAPSGDDRFWVSIICLCLLLLANGKVVYLPLALPVVLLLNWRRVGATARCVACMALSVIVGALLNPQFHSVGGAEGDVVKEQVLYAASHPLAFAQTIISSLERFGDFYAVSAFGVLGSLDTNFSLPIVVLITVSTIAIFLVEAVCNRYHTPLTMRAAFVAASVLSVVGFMGATYAIWTSRSVGVGGSYVDGVQGRYFLPILPFILIALMPRFGRPRFAPKIAPGVFFIATIFLTQTILVVFLRFWI